MQDWRRVFGKSSAESKVVMSFADKFRDVWKKNKWKVLPRWMKEHWLGNWYVVKYTLERGAVVPYTASMPLEIEWYFLCGLVEVVKQ